MSAYFFDTSGLVKRYVKETGTGWVFTIFRPIKTNRIYVAKITFTEVISAIVRRKRSLSISQNVADKSIARFKRAFDGKFRHIEINQKLLNSSGDLAEKYFLRAYDAVQLAAALKANDKRISIGASAITFVSADNNLNKAASAEGLQIENPNNYS